jgi:hypothetical protein
MMEALASARLGPRPAGHGLVAGVFSLLDVLLAMPMTEIVAALSLALDVCAPAGPRRPLGDLLALVEQHAVAEPGAGRHLPETYWRSQLQAYHWAIQVSRNLTDRATRLRFPATARLCATRCCAARPGTEELGRIVRAVMNSPLASSCPRPAPRLPRRAAVCARHARPAARISASTTTASAASPCPAARLQRRRPPHLASLAA